MSQQPQQRSGGGARPTSVGSGAAGGGRGGSSSGSRPPYRTPRANTKFKGETEGLDKCRFDECSGYEWTSKFVLRHYENETNDDFILPKASFCRKKDGTKYLEVEGAIICEDFDRFIKEEKARIKNLEIREEITRIDQEHGESIDYDIPKLSVLCIRSLHKQESPFARGESDPSSIIFKAMQAKD